MATILRLKDDADRKVTLHVSENKERISHDGIFVRIKVHNYEIVLSAREVVAAYDLVTAKVDD